MNPAHALSLHGVPTWIDVVQDDLEATRAFYGGLFGWTFSGPAPQEEGPTLHAYSRGEVIATATGGHGDPRWRTYFAVDNLGSACTATLAIGGRVRSVVTGHAGRGRWASIEDPRGATIMLWQTAGHHQLGRGRQQGEWTFTTLHTSSPSADIEWYGQLFNWEAAPAPGATMMSLPGLSARLVAAGWPSVSRRLNLPDRLDDLVAWVSVLGGPPTWVPVFAVDDRDQAARLATGLGAKLTHTVDLPNSRNAVIEDPQGATFVMSQIVRVDPPDRAAGPAHLVAVPSDQSA